MDGSWALSLGGSSDRDVDKSHYGLIRSKKGVLDVKQAGAELRGLVSRREREQE